MSHSRSIVIQYQQDWSNAETQWNTTLESWRDEKSRKFEGRYWSIIGQQVNLIMSALQDAAVSIEESQSNIPR